MLESSRLKRVNNDIHIYSVVLQQNNLSSKDIRRLPLHGHLLSRPSGAQGSNQKFYFHLQHINNNFC